MNTLKRLIRVVCLLAVGVLPGVVSAAIVQTKTFTDGQAGISQTNQGPASVTDLINDGQSTLANFTTSGFAGFGNVTNLNNGTLGVPAGIGSVAGENADGIFSATFTLDTAVNTLGYDITGIDSHVGYDFSSRASQNYEVWYTTVGNATFTLLGTATYSPSFSGNPASTLIKWTDTTGTLVSGVNALRFDIKPFNGTFGNGGNNEPAYREFDAFGVATVPEPSTLMLFGIAGGLLLRWRKA